jgi:L-tryptophan--pyruvate aminotransferase
MAAYQRRLIDARGEFQGNGGGLMPRMLASPGAGAPSREEHAVTASGGGGVALRGASRPRGGSFSAAKATGRRRTAPGTPLWRVAVFASVALNVATLALLLYHYAVSHQHHPAAAASPDRQHHTCVQPETSGKREDGAAARTVESKDRETRAPSTGKPAVTHDSVINLDQ